MDRFPVYLFDVDGTLLDSAEDICGAILDVLAETPCPPMEACGLRKYIGVHLLEMFRDLLPDYGDEQCAELIRRYRTVYPAREHRCTRVYPGVKEALAALDGRKSTATTKFSTTTRAILDQFGLAQYFDHIQGTDNFPYKPAPDVINVNLQTLAARPEDCLMVGDSAADMEAGRRAGVKICAVRYGYGDPEMLAKYEPDYWVEDLRELVV